MFQRRSGFLKYEHADPLPYDCRINNVTLDPELDTDPHQFADDKLKCMEYKYAFLWKLRSGPGSASICR